MSIAVIVQFAVLSAIVAISLWGLCVIFKIREVFVRRRKCDGQAVKNDGLQTVAVVAELKNAISSPLISATELQTTAVEDVRVHVDVPEARRAEIVEGMPENTRGVVQSQPSPSQRTSLAHRESPGNVEYVRLRKEFIGQHAQIRFSILKAWISINILAIFRRAYSDWKTANDLIAIIPSYLEPEAEIFNGRVLLIGTRGHAEQLALPIRHFDASSDLTQCFDLVTNGRTVANSPAVLLRSNGHFEVVSRGSVMQSVLLRLDTAQHKHMEGCLQVENAPEALREDLDAALCRWECIIITDFAPQKFNAVRKNSEVPAPAALVSAKH